MAMSRQTILLICVFLSFTVVIGYAIESEDEYKGKAVNPRLTVVAKTENKTFYLEAAGKSWIDALKYCESQDMAMATVENEEEGEALKKGLPNSNIVYWLDGAEEIKIKSSNGAEYDTAYKIYWQPTLCLSFHPASTPVELRSSACTTSTAQVLCHIRK